MNTRRLQGGSLASYIIVAVLLGVALVGGLYGLQRYNAAQTEVAKNDDTKKNEGQGTSPVAGDDTSSDESKPGGDTAPSERAPADTEKQDTGADELPATGPNDGLLSSVVLAGLTYVSVRMARSRHWTSRGN